MHILKKIKLQKKVSAWDHIYYNGIFGSVRDSYLVEDEKGASYIPCSLIYFCDESGDRQSKLFKGKFRREPMNYYENSLELTETKLSDRLIFDPISEIYFIVQPVDNAVFFDYNSSRKELPSEVPIIFKAEEGFKWAEENSPVLLMEKNLVREVKINNNKLGLYGSIPIGLESQNPDIDFLVYGKDNYYSISSHFQHLQTLNVFGLKTPYDHRQMLVERYVKQFGMDREMAVKIMAEKPKFETENKTVIAFEVASPVNNHDALHTILQKKKINEISLIGKVVDNAESYFFPRVYKIKTNVFDKPIQVLTHRFMAIRGLNQNDEVAVYGILRETIDGMRQIFLESVKHYILPISQMPH